MGDVVIHGELNMKTKFKNNQVVRIKEGFYRGSFVRLVEYKLKDNVHLYKGRMQLKSGDRFNDVNPKKEDWYDEADLIKTIKIFGAYL